MGYLLSPSGSPARRERHRMNNKCRYIRVQKIYDFDYPVAGSSTHHPPFLRVNFARVSAPGISHDGLDFTYRATMAHRVVPVPINPAKIFGRHDITIYQSCQSTRAKSQVDRI
jgi:hypothetical protein